MSFGGGMAASLKGMLGKGKGAGMESMPQVQGSPGMGPQGAPMGMGGMNSGGFGSSGGGGGFGSSDGFGSSKGGKDSTQKGGAPFAGEESENVYAVGIPHTWSDNDVIQSVSGMGFQVKSAKVFEPRSIKGGPPRATAIITFYSVDIARGAIAQLHGQDIGDGMPCQINYKAPKRDKGGFGGGKFGGGGKDGFGGGGSMTFGGGGGKFGGDGKGGGGGGGFSVSGVGGAPVQGGGGGMVGGLGGLTLAQIRGESGGGGGGGGGGNMDFTAPLK